jgi:hypothetical protein
MVVRGGDAGTLEAGEVGRRGGVDERGYHAGERRTANGKRRDTEEHERSTARNL